MNGTKNMTRLATGLWTLPLALSIALTGCGGTNAQTTDTSTEGVAAEEETTERTAISDDTDNGHAIAVSGE